MPYVVRVDNEYIAKGKNYTVQDESFVPFTGMFVEAKRYKTYKSAEKDTKRHGANMAMCREISIVEVKE